MSVCGSLRVGTGRGALAGILAMVAVLMIPRTAVASQVMNVDINVPLQIFTNVCAPEPVAASGVLHIVITATTDGSGGYNTTANYNESFSGQGLETNVAYLGSSTNETYFHATPPFPASSKNVLDTEIISKGGSLPNYIVHIDVRTMVTSSGALTVSADNVRMDCTG